MSLAIEESLEESALFEPRILSAEEGPASWFLNTLCTVKATAASTHGSFSLVQHIAPGGFATPYHLHHHEDEAFYVLDGEYTFICDGEKSILGPGGYIFLPRGIPHGVRVDGPAPASTLILASPGTEFVGMMEQMSEPAMERILPPPQEPDMEKLIRLCMQYGIDILGPLPDTEVRQ
jgi:quercetin dioxygenase-like cupin family protein